MSQDAFLIMVGGKSGVGKTGLIDCLIRLYPATYARPISYTSRARRTREGAEEYIFSTEEEMDRMHQEGKFLNYDCVYDYHYAISSSSVYNLLSDGKIPIKEIHPSNHPKVKALLPASVSVLIKGRVNDRYDRESIDNEFYKDIDESLFDIVFANDTNLSIEQNARYLNQRIIAHIKYRKRFPPVAEIDAKNKTGYSLIADEFTEEKRVTTHNFHTLSLGFFQSVINEICDCNATILEIGPGQGWLRNSCAWPNIKYNVLELIREMANYNEADNIIVASASKIPVPSHSYDAVLSSLGDPYFYPDALCEICRVLKPEGLFAFSLPSDKWAKALRGDADETTIFVSDDGQEAQTYSFVLSRDELTELLLDCGFNIIYIDSINGRELEETCEPISPALTRAAENVGMSLNNLDIITVCLCKKRLV